MISSLITISLPGPTPELDGSLRFPYVMDALKRLYYIVARRTPSGQVKRGDKYMEKARHLVEEYGSMIDRATLTTIAHNMAV
jgi:hypothetical protein